jgi:type II secretory pathway component PulF
MFFSRQLPLPALIELCHRLRLSLSAGLTLRDVFRQLATRGSRSLRPVAKRIRDHLDQGDSFEAALEPEQGVFPPLFLAMAAVGEQVGRLPEVMEQLEKYFQLQQKSWRQVRSRSLLPAIQFVIATGVIALLLFVLGAISQSRGTQPQGLFGLTGQAGAIKFLAFVAALFAGVFVLYRFVTRFLGQRALFDRLALRVPDVGGCLQVLAVGRFALALQMTLDTSLAVAKALRLSLQATGNAAFQEQAEVIVASVKRGESVTEALTLGQIFPLEFLSMVAIGEQGGRLVEMMRHQAAHYQEEGERRMKGLTSRITFLIWLFYAVFMVVAILGLARNYLGALGL